LETILLANVFTRLEQKKGQESTGEGNCKGIKENYHEGFLGKESTARSDICRGQGPHKGNIGRRDRRLGKKRVREK